ncbi:hypothetical protein ACVWZ4_000004 [Bradyrhizobium sp. USDA 4472]
MDDQDKPLEHLVETERALDAPADEVVKDEPETASDEPEAAPDDAKARLRAFEDEKFGPDAVRFEGKVERGIGSKFQNMSDAEKAEHAALERLVAAEEELLRATNALAEAQKNHAQASEAADRHAAE